MLQNVIFREIFMQYRNLVRFRNFQNKIICGLENDYLSLLTFGSDFSFFFMELLR